VTGVSAQPQELTGVSAQPQGVDKSWCTGHRRQLEVVCRSQEVTGVSAQSQELTRVGAQPQGVTGVSAQLQELTRVGVQPPGVTGVGAQPPGVTGDSVQPQDTTGVSVWCTGDDWTRSRYHGQGCQGYKERLERTDTEDRHKDRHKTVKRRGREQRLVEGLLYRSGVGWSFHRAERVPSARSDLLTRGSPSEQ